MLPLSLYKYSSFIKEKYLHEIIVESKIYFTSPFNFNDPFDCRPNLVIGTTKKEIQKTKKEFVKSLREYSSLSREARKAMVNLVVTEFGVDQIEKELQKTLSNRGVYCLTNKQDNLLMWSHYGDSHRGLCLEFTTVPKGSFFSHAKPIKYTNDYPIIKGYLDGEEWGNSAFLTKSIEWEYEQEFRLLSNFAGHLVFPPELLVGITFGCKTTDKNISLIKGWISKRENPIKLSKARMNNKQFKVDILTI